MTKKPANKEEAAHKYMRVVSTENQQGEDEIYLYGYIGQAPYWDDDPTEDMSDLAVVRAIREADAKGRPFHIRINSPGGSVFHGEPIVTAIREATNEVHTYNDGLCASMAFDIWLAGDVRHWARNAKGMIHTTSTWCGGNARDMRATADMLDKFDQSSIETLADTMGMEPDEVRRMYYDYEDHWMTAADAQNAGLITSVDAREARHVVANPERMTYAQLLRAATYEVQEAQEDEPAQEPADETETWRADHLARLNILHTKIA